MKELLLCLLALTGLGVLFGAVLSFVHRFFGVELDPRIEKILFHLPGANCGACGLAGCQAAAEAIAHGKAPVTVCVPNTAEHARAIAQIMASSAVEGKTRLTAAVLCNGGDQAVDRYAYRGLRSCAADTLLGGHKACSYGCLGHGDCRTVCFFGAIRMEGGLPVIDPAKCTACGKCVKECPRKIITLIPACAPAYVKCASRDKGARVRQVCKNGCIGCGLCARKFPAVFKVADNLSSVVDYTTREDLTPALQACPTKVIKTLS